MLEILIVDDSNLAQKRVKSMLEDIPIDLKIVDTASDGQEGIRAYIKSRPNLIITDLEMPNMDGHEFIKKIKQLNSDIPIIVISAIINEQIKQSLMKNSYLFVLQKPIDAKLLKILLEKLINKLTIEKGA